MRVPETSAALKATRSTVLQDSPQGLISHGRVADPFNGWHHNSLHRLFAAASVTGSSLR